MADEQPIAIADEATAKNRAVSLAESAKLSSSSVAANARRAWIEAPLAEAPGAPMRDALVWLVVLVDGKETRELAIEMSNGALLRVRKT